MNGTGTRTGKAAAGRGSRRWAIGLIALLLVLCAALWKNFVEADLDGVPMEGAEEKLPVAATFSVIYDIVKTVGGDRVDVHSMVPLGQDPHEYTPLPLDVRKATDAAAIFWNGLDMELGDGWFESLLEIAGKDLHGSRVIALAEGVEPMYLEEGDNVEVNPHAFLSIPAAIRYVENARDGLIRIDPDYAPLYEDNAANYIARLEELHERYVELFGRIPKERRVLVTSERAFQYMAAEYGFTEGYVWAIDTDEQGSPRQIVDLIQFVRKSGVEALFIESNVDPRALETVSRETGVPIVGIVYSDELGKSGEESGTFLGMLQWNLKTIYGGLAGD